MNISKYEIVYYELPSGKCPFQLWFDDLDVKTQNIVDTRLERIELGNLGDHRYLHGGIFELRFRFGPGYRIYCGEFKKEFVVLLCAGDKSSQSKDIVQAQGYWRRYLKEKENANQNS